MDLHFASFQARHDADAGFRLPGENHSQLCSRAGLPLLALEDRITGQDHAARPVLLHRIHLLYLSEREAIKEWRQGINVEDERRTLVRPLHPSQRTFMKRRQAINDEDERRICASPISYKRTRGVINNSDGLRTPRLDP